MEERGAATPAVDDQVDVDPARRGAVRHLPFADQFPQRLEPNGRIVLPATFREAFGEGGYLLVFQRTRLGLWTPHDFARLYRDLARKRQPELTGTVARDALYSTASYVRPDRQGRFVIAEEKRSEVSLATEITVVGAVDRVEIWDRKLWAAHVADAERVLKMEMDTYSGADPDDLL
jgi:MraZ protein